MIKTISFDPNHNSEQRKLEIEMTMQSIEPFELQGMTLKFEDHPDSEYNGDDYELSMADEIEIKYEKA